MALPVRTVTATHPDSGKVLHFPLEDTLTDFTSPARPRLADRVPLDVINERAREETPGHLLLLLAAGLIMGAFWLIGTTYRGLFLPAVWCYAAGNTGWRKSQGKPLRQPDIRKVMAENAQLRAENARLR